MKSNLIPKFLHSKNKLSILALFLLLCVDVATALWKNHLTPWWAIVIPAIPLIAEIIYIVRQKNQPTNIPAFFTKLVSSAVMPSLTGVAYLLAFLMHISWISDGVLGLITEANCTHWVSTVVAVCGLVVLTIFCPVGRKKKNDNATTIFISGMSSLPKNKDIVYEKLNVRPLVSVLQNMSDTDNCRMLILKSKQNSIPEPLLDFLGISEQARQLDNDDDRLRLIIRTVALKEFREKKWIATMPIDFTDECDYDNFSNCYNEIAERVERLDTEDNKLVFNLSPGTTVVSALMTILAIDSQRTLFYYSQDDNLSNTKRLIEVNKSSIPLRNLLSQALESLNQVGE